MRAPPPAKTSVSRPQPGAGAQRAPATNRAPVNGSSGARGGQVNGGVSAGAMAQIEDLNAQVEIAFMFLLDYIWLWNLRSWR